MGKIGRFACIFTPMALTIASLACLVFIYLGGFKKNSSTFTDLYFLKADASNFTANPNFDISSSTNLDNNLLNAFKNSYTNHNLSDIYTVYLFNYCSGNKSTDGSYSLTYCSPRKNEFWFNPVEVWDLNDTSVSNLFPSKLNDGLKAYHTVSKWMFIAYEVALWSTVIEIVVGLTAIFSRWGSFLTTIVSSVSSTFVFAAALTSTILYSTLAATFNSVLKPYRIHASLSTHTLAVVWLAVAFSLGAGFFWLISVCCCSGRSDSPGRKKVMVEKTPYTYERVASPYMGHREGDVPMHNMPSGSHQAYAPGNAYEPFRQV